MVKEIELQNGMFALVDDEDFERVNKYKWYCRLNRKTSVTITQLVPGKALNLSRFIMNAADDELITFNDGNSFNLQKENLKKVTKKEVMLKRRGKRNSTSKYKGVSWNKKKGKWRVCLTVDKKVKNLGYYSNEDQAAIVFNNAVLEYIGENAFLNKIGEDNNAIELKLNKVNKSKNSTGIKGIYKRGNKYVAEFYHNRKQIYLGIFDTLEQAAKAHDKKNYEIHAEKAILNFPEDYKKKNENS